MVIIPSTPKNFHKCKNWHQKNKKIFLQDIRIHKLASIQAHGNIQIPKEFLFIKKKKKKRVTLNIETSQYASNTGGHQKGPNFKNVFLFHILSKYSCLRILEQENKEINK
jgi:hypothetical protein